ncbi:hypothetical protein [Paraburkholderia sp. RL17-337-BIB-A]|uniref:hypothetical protein n=1 Tax=Paraburkholderia sp. RL17-337-BIB-A TaxID=3031636 RepID=UPI0038BB773B
MSDSRRGIIAVLNPHLKTVKYGEDFQEIFLMTADCEAPFRQPSKKHAKPIGENIQERAR